MRILVDGRDSAGLKPGEEFEIELPPDGHTVQARMDWCRSPVLSVSIDVSRTTHVEVEYPFWHGYKHLLYKPHEAIYIREVTVK